MDNGIDYSIGAPSGASMENAGFEFACRYLVSAARRANGDMRGLTPAEYRDLRAHNRKLVLILEGQANGMQRGYDGGYADAVYAQSVINEYVPLGMPKLSPAYYTADFDLVTQADFDAVASYLKGAQDARGGDLSIVGCYGEYDCVKFVHENGHAGLTWQTYAWSRGLLYPSTNIYQYDNYQNWLDGVDVDYDRALFPYYGQIPLVPPTPPPPVYPKADLPEWFERSLAQQAPHNAKDAHGVMWEVARRNVTLAADVFPYEKPDTHSKHVGPEMKAGMRLRLERVADIATKTSTGRVTHRQWALMREGFYIPGQKYRPRVKLY